jgi:hexulose-6-phosphate isomerase
MKAVHPHVGFMQGRLSPLVEGKIQAFPWAEWDQEFAIARGLGLTRMEWTMDQERIGENPLMTAEGRARIGELVAANGIIIPSLTGDFCMQAPFWKAHGQARAELVALFADVVRACAEVGIGLIVVPLVDNGSLTSHDDRDALTGTLLKLHPLLTQTGVKIAFESDFAPAPLAALIADFPAASFGINYDMGNSASLGWNPDEELPLLAPRIVNVHVKDRLLGGTTVALGQGAADLARQFALLRQAGYAGNYILQTARATDGDHAGTIRRYADFVTAQLEHPDAA